MPVLRISIPLLAVLLLAGECLAQGYPRPRAATDRWELNFTAGDLRIYVDPVEDRPYWYFTYRIENRTGDDQVWAPRFVLYTDAGEVIVSGRDVPTRVTNDLMELLDNEFLENQNEIIGTLLQGREHAREGLVLWPMKEREITEVSLFISGISGDTARIHNPLTGEPILLRKTLQRDYRISGDPVARGSRPVELVEQRWIFR